MQVLHQDGKIMFATKAKYRHSAICGRACFWRDQTTDGVESAQIEYRVSHPNQRGSCRTFYWLLPPIHPAKSVYGKLSEP